MAGPQLEHGHTRIAHEILEEVSKVNLNGTQFRLIMAVWRSTYGYHKKSHELSISYLAKFIKASRGQVDRELSTLIEMNIIKVFGSGQRGVRLLGFNKNFKEWHNDCTLNRGLSAKQSTVVSSNQSTELSSNQRNKKDIYKDNNKDNMYVEIIDYLNKKTGKRYSPKSAANQKLINGRMSEGRTLEDFKHVIDVKVDEWLNNEEMQQYLRPATLFRPTNFENYLNQKPKFKAEKQSDPRDKEIAFQKWMSENPDADPNDFDWETGKGVKRDE